MSSVSKLGAALLVASTSLVAQQPVSLRVCADPNNLPYSNDQKQGFENRIAEMIGRDLQRPVTYFWFPQREKFFRSTLNRGVCDVVMGVPVGLDEASTTQPYYRSTYVFVTRRDRALSLQGFDDPRLRTLKIGVHVLGEQDDSVPPVHAFTSRGIVHNLVGYSIFGNLNEANPPADLVKAVANKDIDVAVVWGPLAGYFAAQSPVPLDITPVDSDNRNPSLPFHYDIAIGVRTNDTGLRKELNDELTRRHAEIVHILRSYGIPQDDNHPQPASGSKGE